MTVPLDTSSFLYDYKNSEFIECNYKLAQTINKFSEQNSSKNLLFVSRISYVKDILESLNMNYWLMAGTLLGWYRECGFIAHTQDADISLYSNGQEAKLQEIFTKDRLLPLRIKFGLGNDSLELNIGKLGIFHMDIFFMYEINKTHQWFPYHLGREVKRTILTKFSLCSGELFGEKFYIPCKPENVLNEIYGENGWKTPNKKFIVSSKLKHWKRWKLDEWVNAIKFYQKGVFLKDFTIKMIKKYLEKYEKILDYELIKG